MATDTLSELGKKKASMVEDFNQILKLARRARADCERIKDAVGWARAIIENNLHRGVEALEFAKELERFKAYGIDVLDMCAHVPEDFANFRPVAEVLSALRKEAEEFVALIDGLLARINRPRPPIDEAKLPQVPAVGAGLAPGFASLEDLRQEDE